MRSRLVIGVMVLAAGGCGSDLADRIETACKKDSGLTEAQCECFADRAERDLSRDAQELILAQIDEDEAKVNELTRKMSLEDASSVGTFLVNATTQCTAGSASEDI